MAGSNTYHLKKLKTMRGQLDWSCEEERRKFLRKLYRMIKSWTGKRPKLRAIFQRDEIDWLLKESVKNLNVLEASAVDRFIDFVIASGYKDEPDRDEAGRPLLSRSTAIHWAARGDYSFLMKYRIRNLFAIYRGEANYVDQFGLTHFHVACQYDCCHVAEAMLERGQDPDCRGQVTIDPPLHLALKHERKKTIELLLRRGADPNLTNKDGFTPLHLLCAKKDGDRDLKLFLKICDERRLTVQIDAPDKSGDTPLIVALKQKRLKSVELLLKRGVNPNAANAEGSTALHVLSKADDAKTMELFFGIVAEVDDQQQVQVDARNKKGWTPLHLALHYGNKKATRLLLRYGANPNVASEDGSTPLHVACCCDSVRILFKICEDARQHQLQVDAADKEGRTPLHLALIKNCRMLSELLLSKGANPNLADAAGSTPLHLICRDNLDDDDFVKKFLRTSHELCRTVEVDARDNKGRTPLQWAVANPLLKVVDVLLDHGADLANFVFPSEDHFDEFLRSRESLLHRGSELDRASRALAVVERLAKRGYELDRSGALAIMKLFDKNGLIENESVNFDHCLGVKYKYLAESVKSLKINPNLSLDELIRLRPAEATRQFTITDLLALVSLDKFRQFPGEFREACIKHLRQIIYGKFCRRWTLDFFMTLTSYRLPILCCDIIIDQLMNEELFRICLAVEIIENEQSQAM